MDSSRWAGTVYPVDTSKYTEEQKEELANSPLWETLPNGMQVMSPMRIIDELNKWKMQQTNTPVKKKKYYRDRYETLTGEMLKPLPNTGKIRRVTSKQSKTK